VPLLVALGEPALLAVGLGQADPGPISAVATVANLTPVGSICVAAPFSR
jgi:hypothetical protein